MRDFLYDLFTKKTKYDEEWKVINLREYKIYCDSCRNEIKEADIRFIMMKSPNLIQIQKLSSLHNIPQFSGGKDFCGIACLNKQLSKDLE